MQINTPYTPPAARSAWPCRAREPVHNTTSTKVSYTFASARFRSSLSFPRTPTAVRHLHFYFALQLYVWCAYGARTEHATEDAPECAQWHVFLGRRVMQASDPLEERSRWPRLFIATFQSLRRPAHPVMPLTYHIHMPLAPRPSQRRRQHLQRRWC